MAVTRGAEIAAYAFPDGHPFGPDRHDVFWRALDHSALAGRVEARAPVLARDDELATFHEAKYVERVRSLSALGHGLLDHGDTPAFAGCYEAAAHVVGSALDLARAILRGELDRGFVPIAGLHHARRERAGGFCIFNDAGVVIEVLRAELGLERFAYVDIDAHHGDGVFYGFVDDPQVTIADLHEDGRFLYPGTGFAHETGEGAARGTKHNFCLQPDDGDEAFERHWSRVEAIVDAARPQLIVLQAGADCLDGDPITHLRCSERSHSLATRTLVGLAKRHCDGHVLALGGGGYHRPNLVRAWLAMVAGLLDDAPGSP
ncbi:MAG: acetoin utilization protein AcuC [Pseudomonadota bacterium]